MARFHYDIFVENYGSEYNAEVEAQIQSEDLEAEAVCDCCGYSDMMEIGLVLTCPNCGVGSLQDIVTVVLMD